LVRQVVGGLECALGVGIFFVWQRRKQDGGNCGVEAASAHRRQQRPTETALSGAQHRVMGCCTRFGRCAVRRMLAALPSPDRNDDEDGETSWIMHAASTLTVTRRITSAPHSTIIIARRRLWTPSSPSSLSSASPSSPSPHHYRPPSLSRAASLSSPPHRHPAIIASATPPSSPRHRTPPSSQRRRRHHRLHPSHCRRMPLRPLASPPPFSSLPLPPPPLASSRCAFSPNRTTTRPPRKYSAIECVRVAARQRRSRVSGRPVRVGENFGRSGRSRQFG